jgi:hypothetical protein
MGGSGLNDLLETVNSPNAVARAVRGHFSVTQTVLLEKIIEVDIVSNLVTENAADIRS